MTESLANARAPWDVDSYHGGPLSPPAWTERAVCAESVYPDDWFAPEGSQEALLAETVCLTCPVKVECLKQAVAQQEQGVWGGVFLREVAVELTPLQQSLQRTRDGKGNFAKSDVPLDRKRDALDMIRSGTSQRAVARLLKLSPMTLRAWMRDLESAA